jgi:hypothetical protein
MIKKKHEAGFEILKNNNNIMTPTSSVISATNFQNKRPRKDNDHILKLDDKRFEPINKDPFVKSDVRRCTGVPKFGNLTGREDLWKEATGCVNG